MVCLLRADAQGRTRLGDAWPPHLSQSNLRCDPRGSQKCLVDGFWRDWAKPVRSHRQHRDYASRVLEGAQEDERLFALVHAADPEDDPWDEATWIKANPSWGQAVQPDAIRAIMRQARNNPAQEAAAKTRHLNLWVGTDEALFSMRDWAECEDRSLRLEDFEGEVCHIGLDLAPKTDLAAMAIVFPARDEEGRTRRPHTGSW